MNMCGLVPGACGCEDFHRWRFCDLWKPFNPEAGFPTCGSGITSIHLLALLWGFSEVMQVRARAGWCLAHKWWGCQLPLVSASSHWLCQVLGAGAAPHSISPALVLSSFSCLLPRDRQVNVCLCKWDYFLDPCHHSPSTSLIFKFDSG